MFHGFLVKTAATTEDPVSSFLRIDCGLWVPIIEVGHTRWIHQGVEGGPGEEGGCLCVYGVWEAGGTRGAWGTRI